MTDAEREMDRPGPLITRPWWRRPGGIGIALFVGSSFVLWGYAFSGLARRTPPDTLRDAAYATTAEPICKAALDDVLALPRAMTAKTATERAVTLDQATDRLDTLVTDLQTIPSTSTFDTDILTQWLGDWDRYRSDRRAYAEALRQDSKAKFTLTARRGEDYTKTMDAMAKVNRMPSCATPGDVG